MKQAATHNARLRLAAAFLLVGLAALLPRLLDLGGFVTHDEVEFWLSRSDSFFQALQSGDYAATAISTHPGVTTMWLGSAGIVLRRTLDAWGVLVDPFPAMLALMRLPVALVHVGGVLLGYALLRRMLPASMALLAALLWATDPFVIGYSRLLHVDALLATFATLCLLAACVYWHHGGGKGFLLLSAVCGALAVLSKSPGLALLPVVALLGLQGMAGRGWRGVWPFALWGAVFVLTIALAWPAVWADPLRVYELLRVGVEAEGAQPHMTGNFFLGQRQDSPGLLFYPAALALRLTPWTLAGLLLLPLAWRWGDLSPTQRRDLLILAGFALLFTLALSVFPKKFNRYLLPIFPALDILAVVGLVWGTGWLAQQAGRFSAGAQRWLPRALAGLLVAAALLNAAWWHPYGLVAFNQALGGAQTGARTFAVGWGEGYPQVAAWLNRQPDSTGVLTISRMITSLNPYLKPGVQAFFPSQGHLRDNAGYVVVYIAEVQGGPPPPPSDAFYGKQPPLHTVTIHGVVYAWVYQVPPPVAQERPARFGEHIHLRGLAEPPTLRRGQPVTLTLSWMTDAPLSSDYWLFAHLVGPEGQRVAQVDMPYATSTWQPGRYQRANLLLTLPADAPAGTYRLTIGLYEQGSGRRLPLDSRFAADPASSGPHALLLGEFRLNDSEP